MGFWGVACTRKAYILQNLAHFKVLFDKAIDFCAVAPVFASAWCLDGTSFVSFLGGNVRFAELFCAFWRGFLSLLAKKISFADAVRSSDGFDA